MGSEVKSQLLNEAEVLVREGGYNNFSFRILADKVGIKSASVHYYFPTKEDLVRELSDRYLDKFMAALGVHDDLIKENKSCLLHFASLFRYAIQHDQKMCLCGVLAGEIDAMPDSVKVSVRAFFESSLNWLVVAFQREQKLSLQKAEAKGLEFFALLEGALLVSKALDKVNVFDTVVDSFVSSNKIK